MNSYPQGYGNPETIKVKPRGPLYSYDVGCRVSSLGARSFEKGLFPYRFAQLSRSSRRKAIPRVNLTVGALTIQNIPHSLNVSDVIRATLVEKVTEPISCFGETFQYTHCGTYNWWMSLPLLLMFVVVLLTSLALRVYTAVLADNVVETPVAETQWMRYALREGHHEGICVEMGSELYAKE